MVSTATEVQDFNIIIIVSPVGVEVSQGVGGIREVLPEDEASVVQRSPTAAARTADQHV